jgi:hypothetical protein
MADLSLSLPSFVFQVQDKEEGLQQVQLQVAEPVLVLVREQPRHKR